MLKVCVFIILKSHMKFFIFLAIDNKGVYILYILNIDSYLVRFLHLFLLVHVFKFRSKHFFFLLSDGDETLGISGDSMDAGDKDGEPLREQVYYCLCKFCV